MAEDKRPLSFIEKLGCSWGPAIAAGCLILLIVGGIVFIMALIGTVFIRGFSGQPYIQGALASGVNCKIAYPLGGDEAKMAEYIDRIIPGPPLKGLGQSFINSGKAGSIHPLMIAFFAQKESSWGTAGIATRDTNNPFGRKATTNQPHVALTNSEGRTVLWYKFDSWQQAVEMHGPYLKTRYIDQGLTTVEQIINVYCPKSDKCDTDGYINQLNSFIADNVAKAGGAFGPDPCTLAGIEGQLTWPVPNFHNTTSRFGWRIHPITKKRSFHNGIDIGTKQQRPEVVAAYSGIVKEIRYNRDESGGSQGKAYGTYVVLEHGGNIFTIYAHLKDISAKLNQNVNAGQALGHVNSTGLSTGNHLHFTVREGGVTGKAVDPCIKYLSC